MGDLSIFELPSTRFQARREDVLEDLRKFAAEHSVEQRTRARYKTWKKAGYSSDTVYRMFGHWIKALEAAGVEGVPSRSRNQTSDDDVLNMFEAAWRWREQVPSVIDLKRHRDATGSGVSHYLITRRFGDYKTFCKMFSQWKLGKISKGELLALKRSGRVRKPLSAKLRYAVMKRDDWRCTLCGASSQQSGVELHIDHIIHVTKGGGDELDNLRTTCTACNLGRGTSE